jgi:UPF0271 protein
MIDINCDMGELNELMDDGTYESLMDHVTSINVACGGHAGDDVMMNTMVELAKAKKVNLGAHPSYPDKENFGRYEIDISISDLKDSISTQIINLIDIANKNGSELSHVKPHGALYNKAAEDKGLAMLIGEVVKSIDPLLPIMCLAGSQMITVLESIGLKAMPESFADRTYEPDGTLRKRSYSNALISNPQIASKQAFNIYYKKRIIAHEGSEFSIDSETICIHSDTENALKIAKAVKQKLIRS